MPRKIHEPRALLLLLSCMSVWSHIYIARIRINRVRKVAILFVVAASLLLYRTAVPCIFVPFKKYIRVFRAGLSIEFAVASWATNYFILAYKHID